MKKIIGIACLVFALCLFQVVGTGTVYAFDKSDVIVASSDTTSDDEGTTDEEAAPDDESAPDDEAPAEDEEAPKSE